MCYHSLSEHVIFTVIKLDLDYEWMINDISYLVSDKKVFT